VWLEILLLYGVTGIPAYVREMVPVVKRIDPHRIQLNTAVRPTPDNLARPVPLVDLQELAALFGPKAELI
jgi:hypothetical protein